ncbi:hypothetical protein M9H77_09292 [Catharanthus roseus]|uniref:Uncharacterized protein n=1 Tax=Catharanthus roseus TaxID=4058 RepID=A0ACC0C0I1_CATRO|nr:hypothetical protein M9H77_09292 [Catharanthus roseus]
MATSLQFCQHVERIALCVASPPYEDLFRTTCLVGLLLICIQLTEGVVPLEGGVHRLGSTEQPVCFGFQTGIDYEMSELVSDDPVQSSGLCPLSLSWCIHDFESSGVVTADVS